MLSNLFGQSSQIFKLHKFKYKRYCFKTIDFNDKMIGIIGSRGVGKTTLIIQYLNSLDISKDSILYISADSILTSSISLYDIAHEFVQHGGKILAIDEIHKYQNFEKELKKNI